MSAKEKLTVLCVSFLLISLNGFTQEVSVEENIENTCLKEDLRQHMEYLASDKLEGRLPGTKGFELSIKYIDSIFNSYKLVKPISKSNYQQNLDIENFLVKEKSIVTIRSDTFHVGKNFILFHFGKLNNEKINGYVVDVEDGICEPEYNIDNFKGLDISGKWLLMNEQISFDILDSLPEELKTVYSDIHTSSLRRAGKAIEKGAIGILFKPTISGIKYWNIRNYSFNNYYCSPTIKSPFRSAKLPILFIDSTFLNTISVNKRVQLTLEKYLEKEDEIVSQNIVGIVNGTDEIRKDEYIVIGAHLDHIGRTDSVIYHGADDNASGSAAIIELANRLVQNPCKRSIIFVLFTAEEIGLLGSNYFVKYSPVNKDSIITMINLDMIGRNDTKAKDVAAIFNYSNDDIKEAIIKAQNDIKIDWEYSRNFTHKNSGDHYSFMNEGIPALLITSGLHSDLHQPADNLLKIDFDLLTNNVEFLYRLLLELANK